MQDDKPKFYLDGKSLGPTETLNARIESYFSDNMIINTPEPIEISLKLDIQMDKLREKYKDLELTDEQIRLVAFNGITPEQIKNMREACKNIVKAFNEAFERLRLFINQISESEDFQKLVNNLENRTKNIERNKKGKRLKTWENKRFYQ